MTPELEIDAEAVRRWAAALQNAGGRLHAGPMPPVPGPHWSSTDAGTAAAAAARRVLMALTDDIIATGRAVVTTVDDYETTDDRAAARLRRIK
ncbi:hypothetical protein COUCH_34955 [Couchioplanes caeruleus]|uniref:hypothetical protein n=1 Tax=Couchioplanes caeruleus TaxID=56438 RepID=UPI0020BEA8DF|nr:hypothetical protein [Couchioplanes caeruleus]UQU64115.1 hypothetical protein COUCH_34955 [Couchioplanes caeruleus]